MTLAELIARGYKITRTEINSQSTQKIDLLFTLERTLDSGEEIEFELEVEVDTTEFDLVQVMNNEVFVSTKSSTLQMEDTSEIKKIEDAAQLLKK